jgi:hypothetical protein
VDTDGADNEPQSKGKVSFVPGSMPRPYQRMLTLLRHRQAADNADAPFETRIAATSQRGKGQRQ